MKITLMPKCDACPLHKTAEYVCLLGQGPKNTDLMAVGEAPGKREDDSGKAFVGKAGMFLEECLEGVGIPRRKIHLTNAVHCRPPDNRTPTKGEVKTCKMWLNYEIKKVEPKFVLLLGNTPLLSITGSQGIKKKRGKPIEKGGIVYFPTYHPSFILRPFGQKFEDVFRRDLKTFAQMAKRGGPRKQKGLHVRIVEDKEILDEALRDITSNAVVGLDTETSGLHPHAPGSWVTSLGIATEKYQWCFPLQHYKSRRYGKPELQRSVVRRVAKALDKCKVVAHNGKFDAKWIRKVFGIRIHIHFDTMLAHYNLDENKPHGLDILAQEYFDAIDYDIPLEEKFGITGTLERHCEYLALDIFYTRKLYFIFRKQFRKDKITMKIFESLTMPVSHMYTDVEMLGVYVDPERLKKAQVYWTRKEERALNRLNKLCPSDNKWKNKKTGEICYGINWNSPQQVGKVLFEDLGLEPLDKTPKGKDSTDESVLLRLSKKHKIPKIILRYREATKNLSTFITAWQRWCVDGRMHPSYKIFGTVTGRPSCEDPNIQQTPRDPRIRSIISAPLGWVLLDADFSQIELRILAELSRDPALLYAYQTGQDVHSKTVQEIFGIDTPTKEERKKGKAINFGFMYGMWWKKFAKYALDNYGVVFTDAQAKRIRKGFFKLYKGIPPWHTKQKRYANKYGEVRNLIGRKRRLPNAMLNDNSWQCSDAERQAINSPVQSMSTDMNLMAAVEIHNTISHDICRIVATVHDNILMEVREDRVEEVTKRVKKIMELSKLIQEFQVEFSIPIIVELARGPWSKGEKIHFKKVA